MYTENVKHRYGVLDMRTKFAVEVTIPLFSVIALLAVTGYIMFDAIYIIAKEKVIRMME